MESSSSGSLMSEPFNDEVYNSHIDKERVTEGWLMVRTPVPVLLILAVYLNFVLRVGPAWMAARTPYQLTWIMRAYNLLQIFINGATLGLGAYNGGLAYAISKTCDVPRDTEVNSAHYLQDLLLYYWVFLIIKILDLMDTVFLVLKKKNSHISFLHVYHHVGMVFFTWVTVKYIKTHQAWALGGINIFVHMVMYTYYFLATFGPSVQKHLWWKRHLTKLQLSQFMVVLAYIFMIYYNGCPISKVFTYIWLINVFVIMCLFVNFYVKVYILKPTESDHKEKQP